MHLLCRSQEGLEPQGAPLNPVVVRRYDFSPDPDGDEARQPQEGQEPYENQNGDLGDQAQVPGTYNASEEAQSDVQYLDDEQYYLGEGTAAYQDPHADHYGDEEWEMELAKVLTILIVFINLTLSLELSLNYSRWGLVRVKWDNVRTVPCSTVIGSRVLIGHTVTAPRLYVQEIVTRQLVMMIS